MRIVINRDSVCAADDMSHHIEEFIVPDDITIAGLFEFLDFKYIPFITGDNVVWALHNHEGEQGPILLKAINLYMEIFYYQRFSAIQK